MDIKALRGTYDILPPRSALWEWAETKARETFSLFGYSEIRTPMFEETRLFSRSIGENTDIVSKEMYTFADRKGRSITLRPEATAPVVRAYLEHQMYQQSSLHRLFYIGPMFRYERPQAGRNRQFYQLGTEILGSTHPYYDAESISLIIFFLNSVGITDTKVKLNSVGDAQCKQNYSGVLKEYFRGRISGMCPDCAVRYEKNTLRILDCKVPECKAVIKDAPPISEHLNPDSKAHFDTVKAYLDSMEIEYSLDPCLVRGLDYYTNTIFEISHTYLGSQDALGGGGRYNNLVEQMGGPSTGAVGFAVGIDRLIIVLETIKQGKNSDETPLDLFILNVDNAVFTRNIELLTKLRYHNVRADVCTEEKSFKAQMRQANKLNARYVLIRGANEISAQKVKLKNMETGTEEELHITDTETFLKQLVERIQNS